MNDELDGFSDGFGPIFLLLGLGAAAVAAGGVYALKKAGVEGPKVWLGLAAAPIVWFGWKAVADARRASSVTSAPAIAAPQAPVVQPLLREIYLP